jgi:hypothetical protein
MNNLSILLIVLLITFQNTSAQTGAGVGTNSPAEKLDVVGAIKIGTTTTTNEGTNQLHSYPNQFLCKKVLVLSAMILACLAECSVHRPFSRGSKW